MWPFTSRSKAKLKTRSVVDGATVKALLDVALQGRKRPDYRHLAQKDEMSVVTMDDIVTVGRKAFMPWRENVWECEDQARAFVHEAQKIAANEGRSWAVGTLRSAATDSLHVYVWAIVLTEGRFGGRDVMFYNPTAKQWASAKDLNQVDYTLT